ncbi:MAG: hypothetical protein ACR2KZ_15805 [Segetibacter sp.]
MKSLITSFLVFCITVTFAQTVPVQQPVEERYQPNYWWWLLGVLVSIGVGVIIYLLIKKDPKRDAVR